MQSNLARFKSLSAFILAFFLSVSMTACFAEDINWQPFSDSTFAKAKKQHRMVLIFGKATWCPWCRRMKSETLTDSTVISLINNNYVPVMIDIDEQSNVADRFNISVVPANIILTGDYQVVDSKTGYLSVSQMTSFLRSNIN